MYALTCPACNDVRHVPFVRAGAVTRCLVCQHQWSIKERQIVCEDHGTVPRPAASVVPPPAADAVVDAPEDDPKGGSMGGLSGLSDLVQGVPRPAPVAARAVSATPALTEAGAAGLSALSPRARAGIAVGVALALVLLMWTALGGRGASAPPGAVSGVEGASARVTESFTTEAMAGGDGSGPDPVDLVSFSTPNEDVASTLPGF